MELEWKEELDRNDWKNSTPALTIAGSQGHINNYWTRHTLFLTDEHTQSFMCIKWSNKLTFQSQIQDFPKEAAPFVWSAKSTRFSGGGV